MRPVTVAAVQVAPSAAPLTPAVIEANTARALALVEACVAATGAELVVLPESVTTGFTTGTDPLALWDLMSEIPGTVVEPFLHAARQLGIYLVAGSYERGTERGVVHNAAVIAGRPATCSASTAKPTRSQPSGPTAAAGSRQATTSAWSRHHSGASA